MDRREFFQTSVVAALAGKVLGDTTLALAAAQAPAAAPAQAAAPRRLILDAYSRHLHWLRTPDDIAEAAIELTCGGVNPTVQRYPGHIDPANVTTQLPAFVQTMQKHGLRVQQVRGGNQTAVDADVERLVGTMAQAGVTHYWLGTDNYDMTEPITPQLDAIKLKVDRFAALNEKHGTTLMYHTRAGANAVGSVVWDLLYVMKDFSPRHVGFHWDTGHMSHHGSNMWELLMRTAGPYVVGMGWKDRSWRQDLDPLGEGGPFPGPGVEDVAPAGRGAGGGRGGARAGGASRGAGRGGAPGRGRGGGWTSPYVPMGTGLVDLFRYATTLRDIQFEGPMELQAEYFNGGAQSGADTLTLPRAQVIGNMKRDVLTIRAAFEQSESGLTI